MTDSVNIAEDLLLMDNVQTVTLTLKRASGDVSVTIDHANSGALTKDQEAAFNMEGNALAWTIADVELNPNGEGREIRPQDELDDGVHVQVVVSAVNNACGGKWDLVTNRKK